MNKRVHRNIKQPKTLKEYLVFSESEEDELLKSASSKTKKSKNLYAKNSVDAYFCKKCNIKCENKTDFVSHLKKHKGQNFLCEDCGKTLSSFIALIEHCNIHKNLKPYKCEVCGHRSRQISVHSRHLLTHEKNPTQVFKCKICSKVFKQNEYLKQHMRKHVGEKPFECSHCSKKFTTKSELNRHSVCHSNSRPFSCHHCNKMFKLKHNLNAHMRMHSEAQIFKCCLCKASFPQQCLMEKHKSTHREAIQYLELEKHNERTVSITSFPFDKKKVLHHQKLTLPSHLNLNDPENVYNSKVYLGFNEAFLPLNLVASSFGTGNSIKLKIVDQMLSKRRNRNSSLASIETNAVLIDKSCIDKNGTEIESATAEKNNLPESIADETTLPAEKQFYLQAESFQKFFGDVPNDEKFSVLESLVATANKLTLPLDFEVSNRLSSVISKLQTILVRSQRNRIQEDCPLSLHAPSCQSCNLSSDIPNPVIKENSSSSTCTARDNLCNRDKVQAEQVYEIGVCKNEKDDKIFNNDTLKKMFAHYKLLLNVLDKHLTKLIL